MRRSFPIAHRVIAFHLGDTVFSLDRNSWRFSDNVEYQPPEFHPFSAANETSPIRPHVEMY